jgi:hypothetical protein
LNQTNVLSLLRSRDAADLFKDNILLYGSDRVSPNLALYFQRSLLKIGEGKT